MSQEEILQLPTDFPEFEKQLRKGGPSLDDSVATAATAPNESFSSLFFNESTTSAEILAVEDNSKTSPQKKPAGRVSFDSVEVRSYERILDVNPSCSEGAAIGIGWKFEGQTKATVDEWERKRQPQRRSRDDLLLDSDLREDLLLDLGYTIFDVAASARDIQTVQSRRLRSILNFDRDEKHRQWKKSVCSFMKRVAKKEVKEKTKA